MSSILGRLTMIKISHPDVYRSLVTYKRSNFGMGDLAEFVKRFEVESRDPELIKKWHPNPYDTSKCFVAIWAYLLGQTPYIYQRNIQVYSIDPGFCDTGMTVGLNAPRTYLQGAKTPYKLIKTPAGIEDSIQGKMFIDDRFGFF